MVGSEDDGIGWREKLTSCVVATEASADRGALELGWTFRASQTEGKTQVLCPSIGLPLTTDHSGRGLTPDSWAIPSPAELILPASGG